MSAHQSTSARQRKSQRLVTTLLGLTLLASLALMASSALAQDAADTLDLEKRVEAGRVCLTVESLVADVADFDVRRFTVFTRRPAKANFRIGQAGAQQQELKRVPGTGSLYFFEAILLTRLENRLVADDNGIPKSEQVLTQFFKFSKGRGGSVETPYRAEDVRRLREVVKVTAKDGCFGFGKEKLIGKVQGRRIRVSVD